EPGTPPTKPVEPTEPGTPPTKPVEPTEPGTPPTKPGGPTEPGTPSTKPGGPTEPGTPSTNPTNPGTTTPPTLPGLERVIKTIPPAILPTPGSPLTPGELAGLVEKYSKDPSKLDALVNDLKGLVDYYESLSAEQKAEFEELYDVNSLNMMLDELEKVASLQMKLPQTDGASQFGMMLVGSALLLAGAWLFVTRRRKA
ncbi:MAG: LPXTG cell wall anchor domain-containing protein, partial [Solibacillus sp.]